MTSVLQELHKREQNLIEKISEQEQKRKELEEDKKKVDRQAEEYSRLIGVLKQRRVVDKEGTDAAGNQHTAQLVRPPRTKLFSFRRYIQKILGSDGAGSKGAKVDNPLPNRMENMHAFRRITSTPNTTEKKAAITSMDRRHTSPRGHKRRSSDEIAYRAGGAYDYRAVINTLGRNPCLK